MAKFTWSADKQELTNMSDYKLKHLNEEYSIKEIQDALITYGKIDLDTFWKFYEKFNNEKDTIKQKIGWNGKPELNTNSFKAWCKRNMGKYYREWSLGFFPLYGYSNDVYITYSITTIHNKLRESFTSLVYNLRREENVWFREHDEYCIIEDKIMDILSNDRLTPPCHLSHGTDGLHIWGDTDDDNNHNYRKPTLDELKQVYNYFIEVQLAINNVPKPDIKY